MCIFCVAGVQTQDPSDRRSNRQNSGVHRDRLFVHPGIIHAGRRLVAGECLLFAADARGSPSQTGKGQDDLACFLFQGWASRLICLTDQIKLMQKIKKLSNKL